MSVTEDTLKHIRLVRKLLYECAENLHYRADHHDASKLESPEKEMFEEWRPKLDAMSVESDEYKDALAHMGEGLVHHYDVNRHHPEHFVDGISGMTLIDALEMVCDWKAAAARKGEVVNMEWVSKRFAVYKDRQLYCIIQNTLDAMQESARQDAV